MMVHAINCVSCCSFLAKRGIKEEIMNFDARRINPETRAAVNALLDKNKKSFDPAAAKRASQAALPLATWVKASVKFSEVLERIQPLETEQEHLQLYVCEGGRGRGRVHSHNYGELEGKEVGCAE